MTKNKKRVLIMIAVLCLMLSTVSMAFAGENITDLNSTQKWKFSVSEFKAKKAYIVKGNVTSGSKHSVYFINAVYDSANATTSTYSQDTIKLVKAGGKISTAVKSSTFSSNKYFRLLLNPYGENTTGCSAHGEQRDSQ